MNGFIKNTISKFRESDMKQIARKKKKLTTLRRVFFMISYFFSMSPLSLNVNVFLASLIQHRQTAQN